MTRRLPFVKSYRDRHGTARHYFRKPGAVSAPLPGEYGSPSFLEAYRDALENAPRRELGATRTVSGSFGALIALYYKTRAYQDLADQTRSTYRNALERFRAKHGEKIVRGFRQRHVVALLDEGAGRQDNLRKVLRLILNHAVERGWIDLHPMTGMRRPRKALKGFLPWSEDEIAAYEAKWPTGSRERLALALALYTLQRRSDVVTMGRQHVRAGKIRVVQRKTGTPLWIPIHPDLQAELDLAPKDQLTFLQTQYGRPFSPAGFTNWFVEKAQEAGLKDRTPHGLRKAGSRRLAEAGCTPHQIMAVTGHQNLSEVTIYTASADQERLADEAMERTKLSTPGERVRQPGR